MSRVTPPVTKFTQAIRSISSSAQAARPSGLLDSQTRQAAYLPSSVSHRKVECTKRELQTNVTKADLVDRLTAHDLTRPHSTLGGHRPVPSSSSSSSSSTPTATYRFMQGFQTSAPKSAAQDTSTIDFFFFPEVSASEPSDSFAKLRVPLLPDNYHPDRSANSGLEIETLDEAVPRPEILIVASHPEDIVPAAMTEVVDAGEELDLNEITKPFSAATKTSQPKESGMLKELWGSMVDDIFGGHGKVKHSF